MSECKPLLTGKVPPPRSRHTCTVVKHFLVVFGGLNHRERYSDVWIYDTKTRTWAEILCEGEVGRCRLTLCNPC